MAIPSKAAVFLLFLLSQLVVLTFYHFEAVDKVGVVVNYGRKRWTNSSNFYEFVFAKKQAKQPSKQPGFLSSIGKTLSDSASSVTDWITSTYDDFFDSGTDQVSYLTNGDVKDKPFAPQIKEQIFLLILITSHPKSSSTRTTIRKTWAGTINSKKFKRKPAKSMNIGSSKRNVYCVFSLGFANDVHLDRHVEKEYYKYGDIIRVDTKDEYKTLVNKIWGGFEWARSVHPKYVLKADDDVYVNTPQFINWLENPELPKQLYAGFIHYRAFVYRDHNSKWFVSRVQFPGSHFPDYCAGPFYVFTGNLLKRLVAQSKVQKKFQVEDAYFGVVARHIGLKPYHAGNAFLLEHYFPLAEITRIPDSRFEELCVMGHGLHEREIQYIHGRYEKIAKKGKL